MSPRHVSDVRPATKLDPPPLDCVPPPHTGANLNPESVYGKMLDPSHGLKLSGVYCVPPAVTVSTSSANS